MKTLAKGLHELDKGLEGDLGERAFFFLGKILFQSKQYDQAEGLLKKAWNLNLIM